MFIDADGHCPLLVVTALAGVVIGGVGGAIYSYAKYGEVRWQNVATGAAIGGAIGLTGGAAAAYLTTGSVFASTSLVFGSAASSWATASTAITTKTSNAMKGTIFENWFYDFNKIASNMRQITVKGIGRIDGLKNGIIYELKNYDWSKYKYLSGVINNFISQASKYQNITEIEGNKVNDIVYYFSSKPPQEVINALLKIGVKVDWVK